MCKLMNNLVIVAIVLALIMGIVSFVPTLNHE